MAESPGTFAGLLRELRTRGRLTQEELAEASGLSRRTIIDLERGTATTPQKATVQLLADALRLIGPERERFEATALGRPLADGPAVTAVRSLPRDVAAFTGREAELTLLAEAAAGVGGGSAVVGIHAIGGMPGIGKTAFAVHAAHQLGPQFPDGQIFLSLHGHTPGQRPADSGDALASLLVAIGVPARQIPPELTARAALWRGRVAEQRLLIVLDDATDSEQVRPLLPGTGGSLVLVTSRRHLSALEDATAISLDTLPPNEAAELFVRLTGRGGLSADDPAVTEIIRLCGYLPLAVGMVARQLRHHPAWSVPERARELASARSRLELMATENLSVAAALDLSYATLSDDQRRLFRRLGLHPGDDIDRYAAAALIGTGLTSARRDLEDLYDRHLLTETAHGRYRLHDLVREHARALADRRDADSERTAAITRLLDYYQRTTARADTLTFHHQRLAADAETVAGSAAAQVPAMDDAEQALAWGRTERPNLLACLDHATANGLHARVIALTIGIAGLLRHDGPWADAITRYTTALTAARSLSDRAGQAHALYELGYMRYVTDDYAVALQVLQEALGIYRDLGDLPGEAETLGYLGAVRLVTHDFVAATQAHEQALDLHRDLGNRPGQAHALTRLGDLLRLTDDYLAASRALQEALEIHRDLGDRYGQAHALSALGEVLRERGDYPAAARAHEQAFNLCREIGNRLGQANTLTALGKVLRLTGDYPAATRALEAALDICRDLGHRLGQAGALNQLGVVLRMTADYPAAAQTLREAQGIYRDLGHRGGQANVLDNLGEVLRMTGDYPAAARALEAALDTYRDLGDRDGETEALNARGTLHRVSGELALAGSCHQRALELSRALDATGHEAEALAGLGRCALAAGDATWGGSLLRQALEIFQRIGATEAAALRTEVDALDRSASAR